MNKTLIILRHEFFRTIRRPGFIILTLIVPVLALLGIGILNIVSGITRPSVEITRVGYVDEMGGFEQYTSQGNVSLVPYGTQDSVKQALLAEEIKAYFIIPPDFVSSGTVNLFSTQAELSAPPEVAAAIQNFMVSNLLSGKVAEDVIVRVQNPVNVIYTTLTATGEVAPQQAGFQNFIIPGVFSLLLALSLVFTSSYVLQSLSEEKENRLMQILLSSVSTRNLLTGKVVGLGLAGLVQVLVWVISFPLLLRLAAASFGGFVTSIQVPANFWILGIIYFILGYGLFAVISACVAAVTSTLQEAQGVAGLYTLFNVSPFWFVSLLMIFPNSPVWAAFTIFPLTSPVLTMMRLGLTGVPTWQIGISLLLLAISVFAVLLLASRLLRIYMLMYGKRPNLKEIMRNLRTA